MKEHLVRDAEETLVLKSEKEEAMRCLFDQIRSDLDKVIREQMADFCLKKSAG